MSDIGIHMSFSCLVRKYFQTVTIYPFDGCQTMTIIIEPVNLEFTKIANIVAGESVGAFDLRLETEKHILLTLEKKWEGNDKKGQITFDVKDYTPY